jgi:hypothetical protein
MAATLTGRRMAIGITLQHVYPLFINCFSDLPALPVYRGFCDTGFCHHKADEKAVS